MTKDIISGLAIAGGMAAIAAGRVPGLRMNRASIAFSTAAFLVATGAISPGDAIAAVDTGTIALLLSMMIIVGGIRSSGLFDLVAARLSGLAGRPLAFLAAIITASGLLSALFLNDTVCLALGPVVAEACLRARRDPVPYLVATATAANVGSAATIIGNPQNILIGARSGLSFADFTLRLGPPALLGLVACWTVVVLAFPKDFLRRASGVGLPSPPASDAAPDSRAACVGPLAAVRIDVPLAAKSLIASVAMLVGFVSGVNVIAAALVPAAFLLASARAGSDRQFAGVDFNLLVLFAGLFVITDAASRTAAFAWLERTVLSGAEASPWAFSAATAAVSNVISNVPAVMALSPIVMRMGDPRNAWLVLAMASTFAGNLTLLGSVANLIVAEGAATRGVRLGFWPYLKAGLPITVITLAIGAAWLSPAP
ncbi:MAG: anion transporter [Spirochaetes bacterium]|nr:anion transporter [Spirochaetota bacterium]MBU1080754.1 anion transporter [Spirochaetota bacterium]